MKVDLLTNTNDDLMIVNTARTSFDKWNEALDMSLNAKDIPRDVALMTYLADHKHISPFFHVRLTLSFSMGDFHTQDFDSTMYRGFEYTRDYSKGKEIIRMSLYGWFRYANQYASAYVQERIYDILKIQYPIAFNALLSASSKHLRASGCTGSEDIRVVYDSELYGPAFIDASFRVTCAIPIARQLFTHTMFATNEVSRRYVSATPTIHKIESMRGRPLGSIKQGSSGEHPDSAMWIQAYEEHCNEAVALYDNMIAAGVAPEQARFVLPQGMETTIIFTGSLLSFARLIINRASTHAQAEVRDVASDMYSNLLEELMEVPEFAIAYNSTHLLLE